jgi:membrane protein insertase Oxa1/YidC/SpoIIIJ
MNTYTYNPRSGGIPGAFARAEAWLDDKGKVAWIAALVVSMIVFWPLGLMLLAYMIWANKFSCPSNRVTHRQPVRSMRGASGNSAFDAYRDETLRRLEEEQQNFEAFLDRLRAARDKAEFDQFMEERARNAEAPEDREDESGKATRGL